MKKQTAPPITFTLGDRIKLPQFSAFRTMYTVWRNGVLYAFLGMRQGWGGAWQFFPLEIATGRTAPLFGAYAPNLDKGIKYHGDGGREEAMQELNNRGLGTEACGRFLDQNELLKATADAREKARKHLTDARVRLNEKIAEQQRYRDIAQTMMLECADSSTGKLRHDMLTAALEYFCNDVKSSKEALARIERELAEVSAE